MPSRGYRCYGSRASRPRAPTPCTSRIPSRRWCFPIARCVDYRGYFREAEPKHEATRLQSDGEDVYIGGVPAYSTLGYFDDPILSSFVRWPETDVARLIFHELAHQLIYLPGDSVFNESYASMVEEVGLERWLAAEHNAELMTQVERTKEVDPESSYAVSRRSISRSVSTSSPIISFID